jgi:cell division protein FtsB
MMISPLAGVKLSDVTPFLIAILGTGGLAGGIVAFLKIRPEAGQIAVTASQGALIVQSGVIDELRKENERLRDRLTAIEAEMSKYNNLAIENWRLRQRVAELEREVKQLKAENGNHEHEGR